MAGRVSGKVALITGGGSGIGRATAIAFGREGANVAIADYNQEGGEQTVRMIKHAGGEALFIEVNVAIAKQVEGSLAASDQGASDRSKIRRVIGSMTMQTLDLK